MGCESNLKAIISLKDVPDYTTLSTRTNSIDKSIFYGIFNIAVALINPSLRFYAIDSIVLEAQTMIAKLDME